MSVVAEDRQGIYLLLDGRVGRPGPGQGAGLAKGRHVRASVQGGAMRVRWAAKEESWPLYASRRAPVAAGVGAAPGQVPYRAGQVWWREGVSNTVVVRAVESDGSMVTTGGGRYRVDGANLGNPTSAARRVNRLLYDPTLPVPHHTYAEGQVWQRLDGTLVRVTEVRVHPDDSRYTARFEDGWRRADGAYSAAPLGSNQRDAVLLVQDVERAPAPPAVPAPPVPAAQPAPARGKVPTGAPLKPDGTVDWQLGQQWRLRNGDFAEVCELDSEDKEFPAELETEEDSSWVTPSGWVNRSSERGDLEEHPQDVVAYVGPGTAAAPTATGLPAGAPLKPDGTVHWQRGQQWRLRNGDVAEVTDVEPDSYDGHLPVLLNRLDGDYGHWYGRTGLVRAEPGPDPHDVIAYVGSPAEAAAQAHADSPLQPGKPLPAVIPYELGQQFLTREGATVTVGQLDPADNSAPAMMRNGVWYTPTGAVYDSDEKNREDPMDLVEFVAHPA